MLYANATSIFSLSSKMITKDQILEKLKECFDPEIPVNIVDLGLIYDIKISPENDVTIDMTLTAVGCPMHALISQDIEEKITSLKGVRNCIVNIVFDPPWTPERMSKDAKKTLGFI